MAADPLPCLFTAEDFFRIEFRTDIKAELDEGVIRMMAGGSRRHAQIQRNLMAFFLRTLGAGPCQPYGSDMAVRTHEHSVRYPDLTVDCGGPGDGPDDKALSDPRVIAEVLSPSTRRVDAGVKLAEYRALPGIDTVLLVDPDAERVRVVQRTGPGAWTDIAWPEPHDVALPALGLVLPHAELFA